MTAQSPERMELQGVLDRALVEEAALCLEDREAQGLPRPVVDASGITEVLMEAMIRLRSLSDLRACVWVNATPALRHYAEIAQVRLEFQTQSEYAQAHRPSASTPTPALRSPQRIVVQCPNCANSMRVPPGRSGSYGCPHCNARLAVDADGRASLPEAT